MNVIVRMNIIVLYRSLVQTIFHQEKKLNSQKSPILFHYVLCIHNDRKVAVYKKVAFKNCTMHLRHAPLLPLLSTPRIVPYKFVISGAQRNSLVLPQLGALVNPAPLLHDSWLHYRPARPGPAPCLTQSLHSPSVLTVHIQQLANRYAVEHGTSPTSSSNCHFYLTFINVLM